MIDQLLYFKECFDYNPGTGAIMWKVRPRNHFQAERIWKIWNTRFANKPAGRVSLGYIGICLDWKNYQAHRIAWFLTHRIWPKDQIDHIDGDRANNRLENLREATNQQNSRNKPINRKSTTGYRNVTYDISRSKFMAFITINRKQINLGRFDTAEEAARVSKRAQLEHYGEFAGINRELSNK